MNYTENFEGIKIDVQAVDIIISDDLQLQIREMVTRLRRHISEVNWVDVYFKEESKHDSNNRKVSIRLGIPGKDAFATDSGINWMTVLRTVEEKIRRQLKKNKKDIGVNG